MVSEKHVWNESDEIMPDVLNPRQSAQWILQNINADEAIRIDTDAVERVALMICNSSLAQLRQLEFSEYELHPNSADQTAVDWIFLVDSINFSFWNAEKENGWSVSEYSGYFALCAAVNRALQHGIPLTSAHCMAGMDKQKLAEIFKSDDGSTIPMLSERLEIIRENGRILLDKFHGSFYNCLLQCNKSACKLLQIIVENFPNFRDFAEYNGRKVSFLKRAQILVADLYNCLHGKDPFANFSDMNKLTMFADYRVPQVLAYLGVLQYPPSILAKFQSGQLLASGSELEVQIRGHSIAACDQISERIGAICDSNGFSKAADPALIDRLRSFYPVDVDVWLWLWRREHADQIEQAGVPFHHCRSIYY